MEKVDKAATGEGFDDARGDSNAMAGRPQDLAVSRMSTSTREEEKGEKVEKEEDGIQLMRFVSPYKFM
jgi:hypothetical protein